MGRNLKPKSVKSLTELGRRQLSPSFFMRDFLYSEIAAVHGLLNAPDNPDLALSNGSRLCIELLEPLQVVFGRITVRSAYRSPAVNEYGNRHGYGCARNEENYAGHIWDMPDANGRGAIACVVVPKFIEQNSGEEDWKKLAWWIHDNLPYSTLEFYPKLRAFNIGWHEQPARTIYSYITGSKGFLTRPGMDNHAGRHEAEWAGILD